MFTKAQLEDFSALLNILQTHEQAFDHKINFDKSSIKFSTNVDHRKCHEIIGCIELQDEVPYNVYLGLPTMVGRNKRKSFFDFKEWVRNRV